MTTITGTSADETLGGTGSADTIVGLNGQDTITGGDGNDVLYGDADPSDPSTKIWGGVADISGGDFLLNTTVTDGDQQDVDVAALQNGKFVTVWSGKGTGDTQGIFGSIANNDGTIFTAELAIGTGANSQYDPQVTTLSNGNFVVTWEEYDVGLDVFQRLYSENGIALTSATKVNTTTTDHQFNASVTARANGEYAVVWENEDHGVFQRLYNANGTTASGEIEFTSVSGKDSTYPVVRSFADGSYVATWEERDASTNGQDKVMFQFFNADGSDNGSAYRVTSNTISGSYTESAPNIATLSDGNVLITWSEQGTPNGFYAGIFDSSGSVVGSVHSFDQREVTNMVVLPDDTFVLMWAGTSHLDQYAQIYNQSWEKIGMQFEVNMKEEGYQDIEADRSTHYTADATLLDNGDIAFVWVDQSGRDSVAGGIYGRVMSVASGPVVSGNDSISGGNGDDVIHGSGGDDTLSGGSGNDTLYGDDYATTGFGLNKSLDILDVSHGDFLLNTVVVDGDQQDTDVAALQNGKFVTVWSGKGTGDTQGIFGCITTNDGSTISLTEIAIGTGGNSQYDPQVTTLSNGNFVVTWEEYDVGLDVFQRLYSSSGTAITSATKVNTTTTDHQFNATVTARADGEYVVAWENEDHGVFQRLYNDDGTTASGEIEFTSVSGKDSTFPMLRSFADGSYVATWEERDASTNGQDKVMFQFFNADGSDNGSAYRVTSNTISGSYTESAPSIATLSDGDVLITWSEVGTPNGRFAGIFDSSGSLVGSVHSFEQREVTNMLVLPDDTFLLMWRADSGIQTDQYAQRYNQSFEKIGVQFEVNMKEEGYQEIEADRGGYTAEATLLDNGDIAFVWVDQSGRDSIAGGIYGRVIGLPDAALMTSNDSLDGGDGDDVLSGGVGNDVLTAGDGNDTLNGGEGNDTLTGGNGNDSYDGGKGNDYFVMDSSDVTYNAFDGGRGTDTLEITGSTGVTFTLDTHSIEVANGSDGGNDSLTSSGSSGLGVTIFGLGGNDTLTGAGYNDSLYGGAGNDSIVGGNGINEMLGGTGDDTLTGGTGNDSLTGGTGNDVLTGGSGADTYFYNDLSDSGVGTGNRDIITDFSQADGDIISLYQLPLMFGLVYRGTSAFDGVSLEVRYFQTGGNTIVQVDTDKDTVADLEIQLTGNITLTSSDFHL